MNLHYLPARLTYAAIAILAVSGLPSRLLAAEYQIQPGDTIEVAIVGFPELQSRSAVDIDGKISIPLIGRLTAAGLILSELRQSIETLLPSRTFRQRSSDGKEFTAFITPQQLNISFAQYRPIYIGGDVSRPGELPFRPRMTVGDAVSAAGGYDVLRFRSENPFLDSANLRNEHQTLWINFVREQARSWRLRRELGEQIELRQGEFNEAPVPTSLLAEIERLETDQLRTRNEDHQKEQLYLRAAIQQAQERARILAQQQSREEEGLRADNADLARGTTQFQQGVSTFMRFQDARRASLLSATRLLQTSTRLAEVEKEQQDLTRNLDRLDDTRRITLLRELQDAGIRLAELRSSLQATSEKVQYVGILRSQLVRGAGSGARLTIVRHNLEGRREFIVQEDAELMPGDRVAISLAAE